MILKRPICFIDLETTGKNVQEARIVEIAICKLSPDNSRELYVQRVNPIIPIPQEASAIHGIYPADIVGKPIFDMIARKVLAFIEGCDIGGYASNRYDAPILLNEFHRCGVKWDYTQHSYIDAMQIFKIMESRTLSAASEFYLGKPLENAHSAEADIMATVDVFVEQYKKYKLPDTVEALQDFCNYGKKLLDLSGKFILNDMGLPVFNFGKHKGELVASNFSYLDWFVREGQGGIDTMTVARQLHAQMTE